LEIEPENVAARAEAARLKAALKEYKEQSRAMAQRMTKGGKAKSANAGVGKERIKDLNKNISNETNTLTSSSSSEQPRPSNTAPGGPSVSSSGATNGHSSNNIGKPINNTDSNELMRDDRTSTQIEGKMKYEGRGWSFLLLGITSVCVVLVSIGIGCYVSLN
jgi:hypothetical protein